MTNVELIAMHMLGTRTKDINAIGACIAPSLEKEAIYALFDMDIRYLEN